MSRGQTHFESFVWPSPADPQLFRVDPIIGGISTFRIGFRLTAGGNDSQTSRWQRFPFYLFPHCVVKQFLQALSGRSEGAQSPLHLAPRSFKFHVHQGSASRYLSVKPILGMGIQ